MHVNLTRVLLSTSPLYRTIPCVLACPMESTVRLLIPCAHPEIKTHLGRLKIWLRWAPQLTQAGVGRKKAKKVSAPIFQRRKRHVLCTRDLNDRGWVAREVKRFVRRLSRNAS